LWKLPPADTRRRLAVLQRHGLLQVSHDGGKPHWHLHQAVYHYAAQQLAPYPEEKKIAQTWIERAQAHPVVQKYFEKVKHYPREAIRRHYGQMIRFRLQQLPQKLWSMWKREADPTRQENDAQAFSFATIISSTSSFLCTEEYLILLKLQNESRLKRVALHPGWLFFILTTIASVALMGILLIVPIWGYLFNALALTLLTGIQCIFFLLVTFVLLPLAFREGPRLAAFHYWLSERLKQKKKCP
ncbi:MAG: hypothetical protein GY796_29730, partial [Chloroflexi bacterium]|nr:hypothetical protein [Chloroflexota bacterium]